MTVIQNARTSGGGYVPQVPTRAATVGPVRNVEGRLRFDLAPGASRQSVRHPAHGADDQQARARIPACRCRCWPIIPHVKFNYYRGGIGTVEAEMH